MVAELLSASAPVKPPVPTWELVAVPVLLASSWPWAAPPTTTPVPAPNRAAPNAAATAFRMFMCFLAFLVESSPAEVQPGWLGTIATPGTVRQRNAVEISRVAGAHMAALGDHGGVRAELVDEIEEFVRRGKLWNKDDLNALIGRLEAESDTTDDPIPRQLSAPLRALLVRMRIGAVPNRLASDVEGIVYPRLWKVMEAARDGLPDAELRTRIEVFNRRLSRTFAQEG